MARQRQGNELVHFQSGFLSQQAWRILNLKKFIFIESGGFLWLDPIPLDKTNIYRDETEVSIG